MYSSKDAANSSYPTQWALNPTAYQNIDSNSVDWAALAQQWIAMKEAAAVLSAPPPAPPTKSEAEEGEAPMEVENIENNDSSMPPGAEWNSNSNSWSSGGWNQWGWGWGGNGQMDPKMVGDPSMSGMGPMMDGYVGSDAAAQMPGYSTGPVSATPTFQHGYWTAPQAEAGRAPRPHHPPRSTSRPRDQRSKSRNRDHKSTRSTRTNREKVAVQPVAAPMIPPSMPTSTIDAAKRRQLPAWIREGLEKMEREKQRAIEREQELKVREEAEKEKKRLEQEQLLRMKAEASGEPVLPPKSKFDSDSESEEMPPVQAALPSSLDDSQNGSEEELDPEEEREEDPAPPPLVRKSKEEIMQEVMLGVRRSLTEILVEVTDQEIHMVSQEEYNRYTAAQASRLNAMKASKSRALAAIATGLGLGAYESSSEDSVDEDEQTDLSDQQLQDIIRRRRQEFERTARDIEAEVRQAETVDEPATTTPAGTPQHHTLSDRTSETPPPVESETPEKIPERPLPRDKKPNSKPLDKVDGVKKLETIPEEKLKKSKKELTPSPAKSNKDTTSSSDSESDSSDSSSSSEAEVKVGKPKKRKRRSSTSTDSQKKKKDKRKKSHKNDRPKYDDERSDQSKSRRREDHEIHRFRREDKHKDRYRDREESEDERSDKSKSRRREHERHRSRREDRHKDRHRDRDSEEERPRKRTRRSRSLSYESRTERRHKRSHDRDSRRDRSRDKREKSRDYDRYERCREHDRRRSRSGSHRHRR